MNELPMGVGALPQKIFVVTCSEIDSNAIWLKKNEGTAALRVLVVKPHLHLKISSHCFEL